jgi:hypothetical protein
VRDDHTGIPKAKVVVHGNGLEYRTECDVNGDFIFPAIFEGTYEIEAGIWNYIHESQVDLFQPINKPLEATKGYTDDFDLDLGWTGVRYRHEWYLGPGRTSNRNTGYYYHLWI